MSSTVKVSATVDVVELLKAAASTPLGEICLITIAISLLTFGLFYRSNDTHKTAAFAMLLSGAAMLSGALIWQGKVQGEASPRASTTPVTDPGTPDAHKQIDPPQPNERTRLARTMKQVDPPSAAESSPPSASPITRVAAPRTAELPPVLPKRSGPEANLVSEEKDAHAVSGATDPYQLIIARLPVRQHLEMKSRLGDRRDGWMTIRKISPTAVGLELSASFQFDDPENGSLAGPVPRAIRATRDAAVGWLCGQTSVEMRRSFGNRVSVTVEIVGRQETTDAPCPPSS